MLTIRLYFCTVHIVIYENLNQMLLWFALLNALCDFISLVEVCKLYLLLNSVN